MKKKLFSALAVVIITLSALCLCAHAEATATASLETNLIADGNLVPVTTYLQPEVVTESVNESLYQVILEGLTNMDATIPISSYKLYLNNQNHVAILQDTYSAVINENPSLFYIDQGFSVHYNKYIYLIGEIVPNYIANAEESKVVFEQKSAEILNKCIRKGMTDEDILLALHDYIASESDYNYGENTRHDFTAYGVIVDKIGVCQSYSLAYNYLLSLLGIETKLCISDGVYDDDGNLVSGMDHGWSLVKLNGNWYHVDITWDDPNVGESLKPLNLIFHNYFLLSDAAMADPETGKHYDWVDDVECLDTKYESGYPFLVDENKSVPVTPHSSYSAYLPYFAYKYNQDDGLFYSRLYLPSNAVYYKTDFSGEKFDYISQAEYESVASPKGVSSGAVFSVTDQHAYYADKSHLDNLFITLTNNQDTATKGKVIIALYNEDNQLIGYNTKVVDIAANDTSTVIMSPVADDVVHHGKILYWDNSTESTTNLPLLLKPIVIE